MNVKSSSLFGLVVALALGAGACKQGRGERCQVQSDCESPLVCNQATQTCQDGTGTGIDASVPIDAPVDAPPDAT